MRLKARSLLAAASLLGALPLSAPAQAAPPTLRGCSVTSISTPLQPTTETAMWTIDFFSTPDTFDWRVTCWLQFTPNAFSGEIPGSRITCGGVGAGMTCRSVATFQKHPATAPTFLCVHVVWSDFEGFHTEIHDFDRNPTNGFQCTPVTTTSIGGLRITTATTKR